MKFLCLGYFDPQRMSARPRHEIDAVMAQCRPHLQALYATGQVLFDVGVAEGGKCLQRINGDLEVADIASDQRKEMIGGAFVIEASDMEEAVRVASLHPANQVLQGEGLGWRMEIRAIHHFQLPGGALE